jgi:hypothetical protein
MRYRALGAWLLAVAAGLALLGKSAPTCVSCCPEPSDGSRTITSLPCCGEGCGSNVLKRTWQLELLQVHKDCLQALADGSSFACVDFKAEDGTIVDCFLKKRGNDLIVTDTTLHKIFCAAGGVRSLHRI